MLTPPFMVAALVLIVSGVAKLRSPASAALAARTLGLPVSAVTIRAFAVLECSAGAFAVADPGSVASPITVACLYGLFALLSRLMARRRLSCGCFGEPDVPASNIGALLSAAFVLIAAAAIVWRPHGLAWVLHQTPGVAFVTGLGIAAAAYATVSAYTDLPLAWSAWSAR